MSTKAGTIGVSDRPERFTLWTGAVSALAAAALIMSAVALTVAIRSDGSATSVAVSGTREAAGVGSELWDAGKLEAMKGRVLAETLEVEGSAPLWDTGKLEAMEGRVLAESVGSHGYALWDTGKLEAMAGRVLAETVEAEGSPTLWDAGKLEAMRGRVLAG
jgi:hypothetical protein